ncbi:unnamed protein product [Camellia sinensis]
MLVSTVGDEGFPLSLGFRSPRFKLFIDQRPATGDDNQAIIGDSTNRGTTGSVRRHEAYCEDNNIVGGHICLLGWPIANVSNSTQLHLVATLVLDCVTRMLWPINGWSWSDAISNLPTRGSTVAADG